MVSHLGLRTGCAPYFFDVFCALSISSRHLLTSRWDQFWRWYRRTAIAWFRHGCAIPNEKPSFKLTMVWGHAWVFILWVISKLGMLYTFFTLTFRTVVGSASSNSFKGTVIFSFDKEKTLLWCLQKYVYFISHYIPSPLTHKKIRKGRKVRR